MSKQTPPAVNPVGCTSWPVYALLSTLSILASVLPGPLVYGACWFGAALLYLVTVWREPRANRRNRGAQRHMRIVFGRDMPAAELRRLTWRYCLHMSYLLAEELRLRLLTPRRLTAHVDLSEAMPLAERVQAGGGLIVATGHFGNWEVLGMSAAHLVDSLTSLARPCPEPGLQRFMQVNRARYGQEVLSKFAPMGGLWTLKKALKRGGVVGLNMDENTRSGVFVPFCGVLAATNKTAATLQRWTQAPIAVMTCPRVRPGRWRVRVWAVIEPQPDADADAELMRVTAEVAAGFERALRAHPEQWMWSLRRWETRPEGEALDAEGFPPPAP